MVHVYLVKPSWIQCINGDPDKLNNVRFRVMTIRTVYCASYDFFFLSKHTNTNHTFTGIYVHMHVHPNLPYCKPFAWWRQTYPVIFFKWQLNYETPVNDLTKYTSYFTFFFFYFVSTKANHRLINITTWYEQMKKEVDTREWLYICVWRLSIL